MNNLNNRQIRIFVSSTFEDMSMERSELAKTFRELSIKARAYNASLHAIDLRWGIHPGESVVELCLNEIENSHPFFLGIVGDRYGTTPSISEFRENKNLQIKYGKWLEDAFEKGMSYTEIEMQFGAFMEMEKAGYNGHIAFFLKDSALKDGNSKTINLINKIKCYQNKGLCDVDYYSSVTELIGKVRKYYENELETLFPISQLKEFQKEQLVQKAILEEKAANYLPYNDYCAKLDSFVKDNNNQYFVLTGKDGVGKSSLLAHWLKLHNGDDSVRFVYNFIGDGVLKYNVETIREQIYAEVADLYAIVKPKRGITAKDIADLFSDIPTDKPLAIVLVNVSKLFRNAENEPVTLEWLPIPIDSKIKLIMSDVPKDALNHSSIKQECLLEIKPLQETSERIKLIKLIDDFLGDYGKKMSDDEKKMLANSDICSNCFILKTILNELIYFGKYDNIKEIINWFVETEDKDKTLFDKLLVHYENNYSTDMVKDVLSLLVVSKFGLEENDIVDILKIRQLDWSQLFCALNLHLSKNNGKIRFAHQDIINAVENRYGNNLRKYRKMLVEFYHDKVKNDYVHNYIAILEVAYQCYKLKDSVSLYSHLSDFQQCNVLLRYDYFNTGLYWKFLMEFDINRYNITVYEHAVDTITEEYALFLRDISMFCFDVLSDNQAALKFMEICQNAHAKLFGEQSVEVAVDYERMGEIVRSTGYLNDPLGQALEYYQKAYEILIDLPGNHKKEIFDNLLAMGEFMEQLNFSPADNYPFIKALNLLNELEVDSSTIARIIQDFADKKFIHGKYEEARKYYMDSIRFRKHMVHPSHPSIANKYISIGRTYEAEGNYLKAVEYYMLAKEMLEELFGKQHDTCGRVNYFIGRALCGMRKDEEGLKYIDDAINIWNNILGEENAGSAEALLFKANVYAEMNNSDEPSKQARIYAEKAIEIYEKIGNWNDKANMGYSFLAGMYEKKYPKIAELYLRKLHPLIEPID